MAGQTRQHRMRGQADRRRPQPSFLPISLTVTSSSSGSCCHTNTSFAALNTKPTARHRRSPSCRSEAAAAAANRIVHLFSFSLPASNYPKARPPCPSSATTVWEFPLFCYTMLKVRSMILFCSVLSASSRKILLTFRCTVVRLAIVASRRCCGG